MGMSCGWLAGFQCRFYGIAAGFAPECGSPVVWMGNFARSIVASFFYAAFLPVSLPSTVMYRFVAIRNQIRSHLDSITQLLDEADVLPLDAQDGLPLSFDDVKRTVTWLGGTTVLGTKSYRFLKHLWESPLHRAKTITLERSVWNDNKVKLRQSAISTTQGPKQIKVLTASVPQETIDKFLRRLKKVLYRSDFPYEIAPARNNKTGEIDGYKLKKCNMS
jgi:hypothetical protein